MPQAAKAANRDNLLAGGPQSAGHGRVCTGEARLAYVPRYVLATMPGSAVPNMLDGMPDPAQPEARISETGQGAATPAATGRQPETVRAVNQAAPISFAVSNLSSNCLAWPDHFGTPSAAGQRGVRSPLRWGSDPAGPGRPICRPR